MSKHTPGPWWVGGDRPGEHAAAFPAIKAFVDGTNAINICKVGHNNQYRGQGGRDWPNARLIAAAPDLLEALQDFSEYAHAKECETDGPVKYSHGEITGLAYAARAAIAKARGQA